jgi:hypothetical protein
MKPYSEEFTVYISNILIINNISVNKCKRMETIVNCLQRKV